MTEEEISRPKTSGKKSTPRELEEWARKKSPVSSPKPPSAAPPAPEPEPEPVFAMKKGLPEIPGKSQARFVAGDRGVTGGFFTGMSCESGQNSGVFVKPCSMRDADMPLRIPAAASRFLPCVGGELFTGEGEVVAGLSQK